MARQYVDILPEALPSYLKSSKEGEVYPTVPVMEAIGQEIDTYPLPAIKGFFDEQFDPRTCQAQYIPLLEQLYGIDFFYSTMEQTRRNMLSKIKQINKIKSSALSYELAFGVLGFSNINLIITSTGTSFDSDITLDDPNRFFDQQTGCVECNQYIIQIAGTNPLTNEDRAAIFNLARYLEPLSAQLLEIQYNGEVVIPVLPELSINVLNPGIGQLQYNQSATPGITFTVVDGFLVAQGDNEGRYSIVDGYLIYS